MLIVLFFQCIAALLSPANRKREGIKWELVSYTVVVFSFATVSTAIKFNTQSDSFIDNREFTDSDGTLLGPLGYESTTHLTVLGTTTNLVFVLNNWLADGLLVSRLLDTAPAIPYV